jgi:hypothetical protein
MSVTTMSGRAWATYASSASASPTAATGRTLALLGRPPGSVAGRRCGRPGWSAGLVGTAAVLVGGLVAGVVGWVVEHAITQDVPGVELTVPWPSLAAIAATCLSLTLLAAYVGARPGATANG